MTLLPVKFSHLSECHVGKKNNNGIKHFEFVCFVTFGHKNVENHRTRFQLLNIMCTTNITMRESDTASYLYYDYVVNDVNLEEDGSQHLHNEAFLVVCFELKVLLICHY